MESFLTKYLSLILLGVIVTISLTTLFRVSKNLEKAIESISNAELMIDSSLIIIKNQRTYLDSLIVINEKLLIELDSVKNSNSKFSTSIKEKLNTAQSYLWTINAEIGKLPKKLPKPE